MNEPPRPEPPAGAVARLSRVFRHEQADRLVSRAVELGLVSADRAREARGLADDDGRLITDVLVERGWIDQAALEAAAGAEARRDFARPSMVRAPPAPAEVEAFASDPERNLGEFVLTALLGRGGTGEVWKAWDRRLGRWVAVKISTSALDSASARERFEREALATARLAHPHIITVFQVGTARERCFLVMPYIEGQTLEQQQLPVPESLQVMHTVALAVEYAHGKGIVHRDLKPGNVILDRAGQPFVLDFGLAYLKEDSSSRLTRFGEVVGTASYLAPEQARGDRSAPDTATDVYGLGATLYAVVTGRAPFTGASLAAVVAQVISTEPDPPRRLKPDLDPRIEAVVLKAMDKDPRRRYGSAGAFAAELQRILEDREVEARQAGVLERLSRSVRRHRVRWAVALVALVAAGAVAVERVRARNDARAAVDTLRELGRLSLETALRLRRAGDVAGMRQALPRLLQAYKGVQDRGAGSAEVEYLMGRMYRAVMDEPKALEHQNRALAMDARYAPALYERAVLLSFEYGRRFDESTDDSGRPAGRDNVLAVERSRPDLMRLRERIVEDLTRLQALPLARESAEAARGILAYHRRQLEEARALFERTLAENPLREEVWDALARINELGGNKRSEETYTRALGHDRGYAPHFAGRCEMRWFMRRLDDAVSDATAALAIDPGLARARVCRASARSEQGFQAMVRGGNPTAAFEQADADLAHALRRGGSAVAYWRRGLLRRWQAELAIRRGRDPAPALDASLADLGRAIGLRPADFAPWSARAQTHAVRATYLLDKGDASAAKPPLTAARSDIEASISRQSVDVLNQSWRRRGLLNALFGRYLAEEGHATWEPFAEAERDFERALARADKEEGWIRLDRGTARVWQGRARARAGGDPLEDWAAAEAETSHAIRLLPDCTDPWLERASLRAERAAYQLSQRRIAAARSDRAAAAADLAQAATREPQNARLAAVREQRGL